jgi:hypothetical protein
MRRLWTKRHTSGTNAMADPRHTQGQSLVGAARLASATDVHAELFGRAQLGAALLALDRERRGEASAAARTLRPQLAAALRAVGRQLRDELLEVPLHVPAAEAERDPIA